MAQACAPVAFRFRCAGSKLAAAPLDPFYGDQCARRPLIPSSALLTLSPANAGKHARRVAQGRAHQRTRRQSEIPIALAAQPFPSFPRLRASPATPTMRTVSMLPARKNLHNGGQIATASNWADCGPSSVEGEGRESSPKRKSVFALGGRLGERASTAALLSYPVSQGLSGKPKDSPRASGSRSHLRHPRLAQAGPNFQHSADQRCCTVLQTLATPRSFSVRQAGAQGSAGALRGPRLPGRSIRAWRSGLHVHTESQDYSDRPRSLDGPNRSPDRTASARDN